MKRLGLLILAIPALLLPLPAAGKVLCNTADARFSEDSELPSIPDLEVPPPAVSAEDVETAQAAFSPRSKQLDLKNALGSLIALDSHEGKPPPVLLLRMENLPGFRAARNCNRVFPILVRPAMSSPDGKTIHAIVGPYTIDYNPAGPPQAWEHDRSDTTGRVYWIFPRYFARNKGEPWKLALHYDEAFQAAVPGSVQRAWLAEAFLDLVMRQYWDSAQALAYPTGVLPTPTDLDQAFLARTGVTCATQPTEFYCLAPRLLELNEVGRPSSLLSPVAFRTSDAVLEGSGLTIGLQQLDIAAADKDEKLLMRRWMPKTLGARPAYREMIRHWTIDGLNSWYSKDAAVANGEVATPAARQAIIEAFVDKFVKDRATWESPISSAYPDWKPEWRTAVALFAVDIRNVSGYSLYLPPGAQDVCTVLESTYRRPTLDGKLAGRSNATFLTHPQIGKRMLRGRRLVEALPGFEDIDWRCLRG